MSQLAQLGRLGLVSYLAAMGTWTLLGPAPLAPREASAPHVAPGARGAAFGVDGPAPVSVVVDGLAAGAWTWGTVADALRSLGLATAAGDRLSASTGAGLLTGQRIVLDRGVPVTVLDAGQPLVARAPRGSVGDLLAAVGVQLGLLDRLDRELSVEIDAGDIVRITRVADRQEDVREAVPFAVRYLADPNLERGRQVVVTTGVPGEVENTYLIHEVDGTEVGRILVVSTELAAPIEEIRRLGTRAPAVPAEIEAMIRAAAARYGADPDQLLRVAWCESRYNPNAYNPSGASGLFQFMPRTWAVNSIRAGYDGASPFDPSAAANVAAWMFARGAASLWTCR